MKKNKKKRKFTLRKVKKLLVKSLMYLLVAIIYLIKLAFNKFNELVVKAFNSMRKGFKTALIYTLVIGNVVNLIPTIELIKSVDFDTQQLATSTMLKVNEVEEVETETTEEKVEVVEEVKTQTRVFATEIENLIYNTSLENGLTENQALILLAISKHETGNWTSWNYKNKNNVGGLWNGAKGTFYSYSTLESGVQAFVKLLKNNYFGLGLNTIELIGNKYCPVGASNDPNGLNVHWIPKVKIFYNEYLEK